MHFRKPKPPRVEEVGGLDTRFMAVNRGRDREVAVAALRESGSVSPRVAELFSRRFSDTVRPAQDGVEFTIDEAPVVLAALNRFTHESGMARPSQRNRALELALDIAELCEIDLPLPTIEDLAGSDLQNNEPWAI